MTTNAEVLAKLKDQHLPRIRGKPTVQDIKDLREWAAEIASSIKTNAYPQGQIQGHLPMVIPEDEFRLEIEDEDFEYEEQTDPGAYSTEVTGDEDEYELEIKKAEHKQRQVDYQKYLGVRTHHVNELVDRLRTRSLQLWRNHAQDLQM